MMFHRVLRSEERSKYTGLRGLEVLPNLYEELLDHYLSRGFKFISAQMLGEHISQNDVPKKFAIVTFDDGYIDNLRYVAESMARRKLPWTLYATTGFIDRTLPCWWYGLAALIDRNSRLDATSIGGPIYSLQNLNQEQKDRVYYELRHRIHSQWSKQEFRDVTEILFEKHSINLRDITNDLAMTWNDLTTIKHLGCDIGAHTVQHLNLLSCTPEQAEAEMRVSKDELGKNMGQTIETFAYPFGDTHSCAEREFALSQKCGFKLAFTTRNRWLQANVLRNNPWALPRINISGTWETLEQVLFRTRGWSQVRESISERSYL